MAVKIKRAYEPARLLRPGESAVMIEVERHAHVLTTRSWSDLSTVPFEATTSRRSPIGKEVAR